MFTGRLPDASGTGAVRLCDGCRTGSVAGVGRGGAQSLLQHADLERPLLGLRAFLTLQARMAILAVLVRRADQGAVTLFLGIRRDVTEGAVGAA